MMQHTNTNMKCECIVHVMCGGMYRYVCLSVRHMLALYTPEPVDCVSDF